MIGVKRRWLRHGSDVEKSYGVASALFNTALFPGDGSGSKRHRACGSTVSPDRPYVWGAGSVQKLVHSYL